MYIRGRFFRERFVTECPGESMTEQSHSDACDINVIVARHARFGSIPPPEYPPQYADVTALQAPLSERIAFSERVLGIYDDVVSSHVSDGQQAQADLQQPGTAPKAQSEAT